MNQGLRRLCLIALLFGLIAILSTAQEAQVYPITWDPVRGAGGYRIELKAADGDILLAKVVDSRVQAYVFSLLPGTYRFRVTTLNRLMLDEQSTAWMPVEIEPLGPPIIVGIQPAAIRAGRSQACTITGKRFSRQLKAVLIDPQGRESSVTIRAASPTSLQIVLPALSVPGSYGLRLNNSPKFSTLLTSAWLVSFPKPTFGSIQPDSIQLGTAKPSFHIQASELAPNPRILLSLHGEPNREIGDDLVNAVKTDGNGLSVSLNLTCPSGDYDVSLINREGETAIPVGSLHILPLPAIGGDQIDPTKVEPSSPPAPPAPASYQRALVLVAAWDYSLPAGAWTTVYAGSPAALNLSADWFFTDHRLPDNGGALAFAAGLSFNLNNYSTSSDPSLVPSSLMIYSLSVHPQLALTLPFMELSLSPGLGLSMATLTSNDGAMAPRSTIDFTFDADLRAVFPLNNWLGIGIDLGYHHYFFTQAFDHIALEACAVFSLTL